MTESRLLESSNNGLYVMTDLLVIQHMSLCENLTIHDWLFAAFSSRLVALFSKMCDVLTDNNKQDCFAAVML